MSAPAPSLTNRIFLASAALAVLTIARRASTASTSRSPPRPRARAATRARRSRRRCSRSTAHALVEHFSREARLLADLPNLKAAIDDQRDPTTVQPIAESTSDCIGSDFCSSPSVTAETLRRCRPDAARRRTPTLPALASAAAGHEAIAFWPHRGGVIQVVAVPICIDPRRAAAELLGTLSVGFSLDFADRPPVQRLTNSDIAFVVDGKLLASTLPPAVWPSLTPLLGRDGLWEQVPLDDQEYIGKTSTISPAATTVDREGMAKSPEPTTRAQVIILRSRTERLGLLNPLHRTLAGIALVAVLIATILSYAIARTVTRPLGAITATMREMAATGDLTRRIATSPHSALWEDEDARLLAATFNTMTDSIARFQREAAQRERLSSLGRLSTVVAHEIRNPLMIIKTALRRLRTAQVSPEDLKTAVADIDEETARLNRLVSEVLDFAKPIKFELAPADLNALCQDAVRAAESDAAPIPIRLDLERGLLPIVTDAERLRAALVNILANARHAVAAREGASALAEPIRMRTRRLRPDRVAIEVRDQGTGIAAEDLSRVFDPYFTTRRTGTGLGLAISRNIIEGLGGTIAMSSRQGDGTEVRIELTTRADS